MINEPYRTNDLLIFLENIWLAQGCCVESRKKNIDDFTRDSRFYKIE